MNVDRYQHLAGRARAMALRGRYTEAAALRQPLLRTVLVALATRPVPHSPAHAPSSKSTPLDPGQGAGQLREQDTSNGFRDRIDTKPAPVADSRANAEGASRRACLR